MKWLFGRESPEPAPELVRAIEDRTSAQYTDTIELLSERIAELELSSEDLFYRRLGTNESDAEFSRTYLRRITRESRLYFLRNPLLNRAVSLQAFYVFGQGLSITARAPDVDAVIQAFLDDPANQTELTSHQARIGKEVALQVDGNLFFVFFSDPNTGEVRVRTLPWDQITDIIMDPEDAKSPWYYRREWQQQQFDPRTGVQAAPQRQIAYYPDWRYRPPQRPATINDAPVQWETPVYHVKVGGLPDMRFGLPETYQALDWVAAYKRFLENWATIVESLARFAWKLQPQGGARGVAAAKTKLGTTLGAGGVGAERNPPPTAGAIAILPEGADLTPIPKTGAIVSADDGRRLLLMVCAAVGLPETFFGDVTTGARATAKTLDRPTELKFVDRRTLWTDVLQDLLSYVIDKAATAPAGALHPGARVTGDQVDLADDPATGEPLDRGIDITFPPILEHDQDMAVAAIVQAATLAGHPSAATLAPKLTTRLLLQALGVADIDELLDQMYPEGEGETLEQPAPPPPAPATEPAPPEAEGPPLDTPAADDGRPTAAAASVKESAAPPVRITLADLDRVRALWGDDPVVGPLLDATTSGQDQA